MDEDQFAVSKELLKTITVDSRVQILKALEDRPMTASELSRFLDRHVTTVSEHLDLLKGSNLIERIERQGRKWIYYKLTKEGKRILHPESYRWVMIIALTFFITISGFYVWNADAYPGQILYGIKRIRESIQLSISSYELDRAEKHIEFAEERLKEAKIISEAGEETGVKELLQEYRNEMSNAEMEIDEAKKKNISVTSVLESLSEVTPKHSIILGHIVMKTPELKDEVRSALGTSMKTHESATQELFNITGKEYNVSAIIPSE